MTHSPALGELNMASIIAKHNEDRWVLEITYSAAEYAQLTSKYESLGLQQASTANAWGRGIPATYWREPNADILLKNVLSRIVNTSTYERSLGVTFRDSINSEVDDNHRVNLAVFRIVPTRSKKRRVAVIPLATVPDAKLAKDLAFGLKVFYTAIFAEARTTGGVKQFKISIEDVSE
jgi:hypothetical protein